MVTLSNVTISILNISQYNISKSTNNCVYSPLNTVNTCVFVCYSKLKCHDGVAICVRWLPHETSKVITWWMGWISEVMGLIILDILFSYLVYYLLTSFIFTFLLFLFLSIIITIDNKINILLCWEKSHIREIVGLTKDLTRVVWYWIDWKLQWWMKMRELERSWGGWGVGRRGILWVEGLMITWNWKERWGGRAWIKNKGVYWGT